MANTYEVEFTERNVLPAFLRLFSEARRNKTREFERLLGALPNVNIGIDNRGNTILHAMVALGKRDCVRAALARGADVRAVNHQRQTALHLAIRSEGVFLINVLLDNCRTEAVPHVVAAADGLGNTALHVAALRGDVMVIRALVDRGAPLLVTNADGLIPFELAKFGSRVWKELQLHTNKLVVRPIVPELRIRLGQ